MDCAFFVFGIPAYLGTKRICLAKRFIKTDIGQVEHGAVAGRIAEGENFIIIFEPESFPNPPDLLRSMAVAANNPACNFTIDHLQARAFQQQVVCIAPCPDPVLSRSAYNHNFGTCRLQYFYFLHSFRPDNMGKGSTGVFVTTGLEIRFTGAGKKELQDPFFRRLVRDDAQFVGQQEGKMEQEARVKQGLSPVKFNQFQEAVPCRDRTIEIKKSNTGFHRFIFLN